MLSRTPSNSRHARYLMALEEYTFKIQYKKGSENVTADTLSRLTTSSESVAAVSIDEITKWKNDQADDNFTSSVIKLVKENRHKNGFAFDENGLICYYGKIVVPDIEKKSLITKYHLNGHFSINKIRDAILGAGYWFPNMRKQIAIETEGCRSCVAKSGPGFSAKNICLPKFPTVEAFEFLAIDLVGPLPVQPTQFRYVLTMIDHSTRWLEAVALRDCSASSCAKALLNTWIYRYGPPAVIHSDNGPQFTGAVLKELLTSHDIMQSHSTPYHPKGNAIVERVHRSLKDRLISAGGSWVEHLPAAVYDINRTRHSATGNSPLELVYGRSGIICQDWPSRERFRKTFNCSRPFVDDYVSVRKSNPASLAPKYFGRFRVISRPSPNVAILEDGSAHNIRRLRFIR